MGVDEEKVSFIKSDSLQQQNKRNLRLSLVVPSGGRTNDGEEHDEDGNEKRPNLYIDSPRTGLFDEDVSEEEITRRRRVGILTLFGIFLSIMFCFFCVSYLSEHESFSALPPTQRRFMSATTAAGAKENLEHYTVGSRHTGTTGNTDMAKYIRSQALGFGIEDSSIKIDEFEILVNEPESLKLVISNSSKTTTIDFMANFKATKKSARMPFPSFHFYSRNGTVAGPLVYANFGASSDYEALVAAGVNVTGSIVLVREGSISLPAKVILAGSFGAVGIITYNDPAEDGYGRGKVVMNGPWRSPDEASFGSVYLGDGDPSTPDGFSDSIIDRISVEEVFSVNNTDNILPSIVSLPVSAKVAQQLLATIPASNLTGANVFGSSWASGHLNVTYYAGPSTSIITVENKNKYQTKKVSNVLITIKGSREADRYVIVGAQRDSLNAGAVSPGSGNAVFLELLRGLGNLITSGWVPHRTLLLASFDGQQFGDVGSSEWIDRHFSHLGGRAIVYLSLRDVVRGAGSLRCEAAASLRKNIYLMSTEIGQPKSEVAKDSFFVTTTSAKRALTDVKSPVVTDSSASLATEAEETESTLLPINSTFAHEDLPDGGNSIYAAWLTQTKKTDATAKLPKIDLPGKSNRFSPFMARLGVPSLELGFDGGYFGVENSANDTFEWMKKFADPSFTFHRAAAQLYGSIALSFADSIFLQYDFTEVARDLVHGENFLLRALEQIGLVEKLPMHRLRASIKEFETAAVDVTKEIKILAGEMVNILSGELVVDLKRVREMNTRLLMTEKAFLLPTGLSRMPWLRHSLYGMSEWDDYRVGYYPGVTHELKRGNAMTIKRELIRLCQTIEQAADILSTPV